MTETTKEDILVILGDAGINYYNQGRDQMLKKEISNLPITLFCIHRNHEIRPQNIQTYHSIDWNGGKALVEDAYPDIFFAIDGEIYQIAGKKCIAIGGVYSVDRYYRIARGWGWWADEQPLAETKQYVEKQLSENENKIYIVFSHTCPLKYEPTEVFLSFIDQDEVDKTTEQWLDSIEQRLSGFVVITIQKKLSVKWNSCIKVF